MRLKYLLKLLLDAKWHWSHLFDFSPFCIFKKASSNCQLGLMQSRTGRICWIFSTVHLQMPPQIFSLNWCKVAQVALVWFFSTVPFQMPPQSASLNWYNITRFSPYSVLREWILKVREVKSEKKQIPFTFSEKWKVKWKYD